MRFLRRWFDPRIRTFMSAPARHAAAENDQTQRLLASMIEADPADGQAVLGLGMIRLREWTAAPEQSTLHEAFTLLSRAVELLPHSAEAYFYLAFAESWTLDTSDEAEQHVQRALELDPLLADQAREIQQRIAAAKTSMQQQAVDQTTLHCAVEHFKQGQALIEGGRYAEAIAQLEAALAAYPAYAEALLALGDAYRRAGDTDQAITMLRRALAIRLGLFDAHVALGALYVARQAHALALQQLELALAQAPEHPQVLRNVGLLQLAVGQAEDAVRSFGQLVALHPTDPDPRLHLATAAIRADDPAGARNALAALDHTALSDPQRQRAAEIAALLGNRAAD